MKYAQKIDHILVPVFTDSIQHKMTSSVTLACHMKSKYPFGNVLAQLGPRDVGTTCQCFEGCRERIGVIARLCFA